MILWAKAEAIGAKCDQRVELLEVVGGNLRVSLCGTGDVVLISPDETCGVEFCNTLKSSLGVRYSVTGTKRMTYSVK